MDWYNRNILKQAKVMVVGCGALGNEVIKNLVLMSVENLIIIDFDEVELANLSRSILFEKSHARESIRKVDAIKERVTKINPAVKLQTIHADICKGVGLSYFEEADVIISCVDNRLARLFINRYAFQFSTPWIDGGIENVSGAVKVYQKGMNCYECNLSLIERRDIAATLSCADISKQYASLESIPTTSISASIIGAIQVQEALKLLHGYHDTVLNHAFHYDGSNNLCLSFNETSHNEECHCQYDDIQVVDSSLTHKDTIEVLFSQIDSTLQESDPLIFLRSPLVLEVQCVQSQTLHKTMLPKYRLKEFYEQELIILDQYDRIDKSFSFPQKSLEEIGYTNNDIVKVLTKEGTMNYLTLNSQS